MGTRYSPPATTHPYPHPGTPPPTHPHVYIPVHGSAVRHMAVGLKSVAQLTLGLYISDFRGITEVYNLVKAGIPNDHIFIPGNE